MLGMSALRAAVAHANRHLPTLYVPRVIPSPRILPRECMSDVIFIFNSSFAFLCRLYDFFPFLFLPKVLDRLHKSTCVAL